MNVVRLMGGLGNQFFQYAFGRLQQLNGIDTRFDSRWYRKPKADRKLILSKFNTTFKEHDFLNQRTINETNYNADLLKEKNKNFFGYWQYLAYYTDIIPLLQKEFTLKEEFYTDQFLEVKELINTQDTTAIHVRRGDYIDKDYLLSIDYYESALNRFKTPIIVFSDDIVWCKVNLRGLIYVDCEDYLAFELMKLCKNQIISRSTFSWWAAILNNNPNKRVLAPTEFVVRKEDKHNYNNLIHYPNDWETI